MASILNTKKTPFLKESGLRVQNMIVILGLIGNVGGGGGGGV